MLVFILQKHCAQRIEWLSTNIRLHRPE
jgi:hypothetical protein